MFSVPIGKNNRKSIHIILMRTGKMTDKRSIVRRCTDKLFGGIDMKWWKVIAFAAATALATFLFLVIPLFEKTSFVRMGVTFEAWIFFAVIIMSNCKRPLESALKTFVFFLVSQPLIYLFQVPFSSMGWGLFGYYRYWFIWTMLTFPMAFVGWFIRKKNWVSLLILLPVLGFLTFTSYNSFIFAFKHFPYQLFTAIFCLAQVILYLYVFTPKLWQRLVGFLVPLAAVIIVHFTVPEVNLNATSFLPDNPVLTESAVAESNDHDIAQVSVSSTGEDSIIAISAHKYGTTGFVIKDGGKEYRYTLEVYEDDNGHVQTRITPAE